MLFQIRFFQIKLDFYKDLLNLINIPRKVSEMLQSIEHNLSLRNENFVCFVSQIIFWLAVCVYKSYVLELKHNKDLLS
jgi:hypothetical protein